MSLEGKYYRMPISEELHPSSYFGNRKMPMAHRHEPNEARVISRQDVERGIIIPTSTTPDAAALLGVMYGTGFIDGRYIKISSPVANQDFVKDIPVLFSKVFNFPVKEPKLHLSQAQKGQGSLILQYDSTVVMSYFTNIVEFPENRERKKETGLPSLIKEASSEIQDQFLKFFLASGGKYSAKQGYIEISSVSKPLLEDVQKLIYARVQKKSSYIGYSNTGTSFTLRIGILPTAELFALGFLNENPEIRKRAILSSENMSIKTKNHLAKTHPVEVPKEESAIKKEAKTGKRRPYRTKTRSLIESLFNNEIDSPETCRAREKLASIDVLSLHFLMQYAEGMTLEGIALDIHRSYYYVASRIYNAMEILFGKSFNR